MYLLDAEAEWNGADDSVAEADIVRYSRINNTFYIH
jgi:hypothetical protein